MNVEEYFLPAPGSHPLLSRFLRSCYLPVKLAYSMLGAQKLLNVIRPSVFHSDYRVLDAYYDMMLERIRRFGLPLEQPVVLELGPGNSYIIPYNFLHHGTRRIYLVDKYPRQSSSEKQKRFFREESVHFMRKYGLENVSYIDMDDCKPCTARLSYIEGDILHIDIPEHVDFVFSVAVLQHVPDIVPLLEKLYSIMRPGALMYHIVDMKDKWHEFGTAFSFYRYSDKVWDGYLTNTSNYVNRLRFGEYMDIFTKCGFDVIHYTSWEYPMDERFLAPRFSTRNDLGIGMAHFFLKKP